MKPTRTTVAYGSLSALAVLATSGVMAAGAQAVNAPLVFDTPTPAPSTTAPVTPAPTPTTPDPGTPAPTTPVPTTPAPTTSTTPAPRTIDGDVIKFRYGPMQVQIVWDGTKFTSIKAVQRPTGGKSGTINDRALPKLEAQALQRQSAQLDAVSGATMSTEAYKKSLQSALDKTKTR